MELPKFLKILRVNFVCAFLFVDAQYVYVCVCVSVLAGETVFIYLCLS